MKISTRLSIIISLTSSSILIIFGITIYLFVSFHQQHDFQDRLKKRLVITENFFLEKGSFSPSEFEKIRSQFLHVLPKETEEIIEIKEGETPIFELQYSEELKKKLLKKKTYSFRDNELQGESKVFPVNGKEYLIIVTAIDEVGIQALSFLMSRIILLILLGIPLIFTVSFVLTKKYLLPISKKIQHANMISASNLDQRLKVINPNDEIGELATAFNRMLDRLEVSFKAQKSFISNASHEIKNPLTAIMGEAEVAMSRTRTPSEYQESLNNILAESETLNSTVNNLLQLSKITGNEEGVLYNKFKFNDFLIEIRDSYNYLNSNNKLILNLEKECFYIVGNKNLLKTAIINLFDNACKYSSNNLVKIELSRKKDWLNLIIRDQGIGIKETDLKKIFEPFYRGNNTRQIKGSGIGLSLCSKIISIHKGTIQIKSTLGVGTQVYVKLPLVLS
jgi:signal transduction histidine kinase